MIADIVGERIAIGNMRAKFEGVKIVRNLSASAIFQARRCVWKI